MSREARRRGTEHPALLQGEWHGWGLDVQSESRRRAPARRTAGSYRSQMNRQDRRRYPRVRAIWPVIVESAEGRVRQGEVVDMGLSGMRIRTDLEARLGTPVTLRVTLPKDTGRIEVVAKVVRKEDDGIAVAFLTLPEGEAERVAPFVSPGDIRRWSPRVAVSLPVRIDAGSEGTIQGRTVDLSTSGARVATERDLSPGDVVILELPGPEIGGTLRLPAVVWEAYSGGGVLVFANLARAEFLRLRDYLSHFS